MASGHARVVSEREGKRVHILDYHRRPRWDELWQGLPWIARPHERGDFERILNGPQCRPYVQYPFTIRRGQRWTGWRARDHVGAIVFTQTEQAFADRTRRLIGPFVVVEPTLLPKSNPNKQWGKWSELVSLLRAQGQAVVQMGPNPRSALPGVEHFVRTRTFRGAAAVLSRADAAVLPEGGLHHAAAVVGVPAVVLFGGYISPETTGYTNHVNLSEGEPCGTWTHCEHCAGIWRRLDPEFVALQLNGLLVAKTKAA